MRLKDVKSLKKLSGKIVLVRADFNVPLKSGQVADDYKIVQSVPTIDYLLDRGAIVVVISHLGRPKKWDKKLSLLPVAKKLQLLVGRPVKFVREKLPVQYYFALVNKFLKMAKPGSLYCLENIRFFAGEENNDKSFAKQLATIADVFVLDGFAVSHREAASVTGVARYLPAYAGLLMKTEITGLERVMHLPKKPLVLMLGGVKTETKIPILQNMLPKVDKVLIGGGIFNTYLFSLGHKLGNTVVDQDRVKEVVKCCRHRKAVLPVDVIVGNRKGKAARIVDVGKGLRLKKDEAVLDIGPETVKLFSRYIKSAKTLVWNGALGYFEQHPYEFGTYALARLLAARSSGKAFGVVGGGETAEIVRQLKIDHDIDLVSTGGGAMLEYLSGKKLPGVKAVMKQLFN